MVQVTFTTIDLIRWRALPRNCLVKMGIHEPLRGDRQSNGIVIDIRGYEGSRETVS